MAIRKVALRLSRARPRNNGNIMTLMRAGAAVDNLSYSYAGKRPGGVPLSAINDASGINTGVKSGGSSYSYDSNGNMVSDGNRGATLTYNFLNLPKTVAVGGKNFQYDYDAGGNKHKYSGDTVNIKYAGGFEYDASNVLKRIATSEGQLVPSGDTLRFDYYLKDHLGNVRLVFSEKGDILQQTDYYPFGLEIDRNSPVVGLNARNGLNRKLYLGKELQVGTGYLDLSRRYYDPTIGRFMQVDPVTDTQEDQSVYQYGWNNPILRSDPNGDMPNGGDDPFLIARLVTTAFFDTKHAIINTAARTFGSDIRAGYKVEDGQQVFETQISRQAVDNSLSGQVREAVNSVADVALAASAGSSPANPGNLLAKTSESQVVRAGKEVVELRHYTSNKGLEGIKKDMEIKAFDQNKVFAEKAKGKPLSAADAADKYGIRKGSARNYVEFKVPYNNLNTIKNAQTGAVEYILNGNVKLDESAKFFKRN